MDEGEYDHAHALNPHHNVPVFPDTLHETLVSLVDSARDPDMLFLPEIAGREDAALRRIVGREEAQEMDRRPRHHLDLVVLRVAVDPERQAALRLAASGGLEGEGVGARSADEQHMRYERPFHRFAAGDSDTGLREEDLVAHAGQDFLSLEILPCPDGEPFRYVYGRIVVHVSLYSLLMRRAGASPSARINSQPSVCFRFGSQGRAYPGTFSVVGPGSAASQATARRLFDALFARDT